MTRGFVYRFYDGLALLAGVLILIGVMVMTADVVAYNILRAPLGWPSDVVQYLFLYSTFLAGGAALITNAHIRMTLVVERLGRRAHFAATVAGFVVSLVYLVVFCWYSWSFVDLALARGWMSMMSHVPLPLAYLYGAMGAGAVLTIIAAAVRFAADLRLPPRMT